MWMHLIFWGFWEKIMNKRLLFCMESNSQAKTDYQYIKATIQRFYADDKKVAYRQEYLGSKTRYKEPAVQKKIKEFQKYNKENSHIIYCIDTDDSDVSPVTNKLLKQIQNYCKINGFDLILFCRDIEDVYWGKRISGNEKVQMSIKFKANKRIQEVQEKQLRKNGDKPHSSNILTVLDCYFTRKPDTANIIV